MLMLDAWLVLPKLVRCGPLFLSSYLSKLLIPFLCLSKHHWCCLSLLLPSLFVMPSLAPPQWSPPPIFLLSLSNIAPMFYYLLSRVPSLQPWSSLSTLLTSVFTSSCILKDWHLGPTNKREQSAFVFTVISYLTSKVFSLSFTYLQVSSFLFSLQMSRIHIFILFKIENGFSRAIYPDYGSPPWTPLRFYPPTQIHTLCLPFIRNRHLTEQQKCNKIK